MLPYRKAEQIGVLDTADWEKYRSDYKKYETILKKYEE